ncbi:MAG: tetratricopeptide repeat protein [Bacteroidales bacterium]|jgi:tetratricopeptide (TPR) repeat protein|nr:tetratricopeptide repeat protein [Bacteroidales bacterium]
MKKIITSTLLLALVLGASAQNKMMREAQKNYSGKKIPEAVGAIRAAMLDPTTPLDAATYLVQARIYVAASDALFANKFPQAEDTAYAALKMSLSLDNSDKNKFLAESEIGKLSTALYEKGSVVYTEGNFSRAADFYQKAYETILLAEQIDTGALFNVALCAEKAEDNARALETYEQLAGMGYRNIIVYQHLALLYEKAERTDDASRMLDVSIEIFPDDSMAYLIAANENLVLDKHEKVVAIGKAAAEKFPVFPLLYIILGASYQNSGDMDNAEINYRKAYEQNSDDYQTNFRIGAFYVEKGNKVKTAAENLPLDAGELYNSEQARAKEIFLKAIPHLVKALELSPDNLAVMKTLRDLYNFIKEGDKAAELNSKINTLEGN